MAHISIEEKHRERSIQALYSASSTLSQTPLPQKIVKAIDDYLMDLVEQCEEGAFNLFPHPGAGDESDPDSD